MMLRAAAPAWFGSRGKVWLIQCCSGIHFSDLPVKIRLLWLWGAASRFSSLSHFDSPDLYFQLPLFLPLPAAYMSTPPETHIWILITPFCHTSIYFGCASLQLSVCFLWLSPRVLALSLPLVFLILMFWFRPSPAFLPVSCPAELWETILHKVGQWAHSKLWLNARQDFLFFSCFCSFL